jgi:hypothetical protein
MYLSVREIFMNFMSDVLVGQTISDVHSDSELTYIMLTNGTLITLRGLVMLELRRSPAVARAEAQD